MEVLCPKCNKGNCRNISAERLYYPSKEDVQKGVSRYDNEIYMTFMCDDCDEEFHRTMEISYVGVEKDALKAKSFTKLKMNDNSDKIINMGELFHIPEERAKQLIDQGNEILEILFKSGFTNISTCDVFNSLLSLPESIEENNMMSYIAGNTIAKLEAVNAKIRDGGMGDLLSHLLRGY